MQNLILSEFAPIKLEDYEKCDFDQMRNACDTKLSVLNDYKTITLSDVAYDIQWVELIGPLIIFTVASLIGFIFQSYS